jgi:hypothetical protein
LSWRCSTSVTVCAGQSFHHDGAVTDKITMFYQSLMDMKGLYGL